MNRSFIPSSILLRLKNFESSKQFMMNFFGTLRTIQLHKK